MAIMGLQKYLARERSDRRLRQLVNYRTSLLNGWARCLELHAKDAIALGEESVRIYTLAAWQETPLFTPKEHATLAWTDAATHVYDGHVPRDVCKEPRRFYSEEDLVDFTIAVITVNAWHRLAIPFRSPVGKYESPMAKE